MYNLKILQLILTYFSDSALYPLEAFIHIVNIVSKYLHRFDIIEVPVFLIFQILKSLQKVKVEFQKRLVFVSGSKKSGIAGLMKLSLQAGVLLRKKALTYKQKLKKRTLEKKQSQIQKQNQLIQLNLFWQKMKLLILKIQKQKLAD